MGFVGGGVWGRLGAHAMRVVAQPLLYSPTATACHHQINRPMSSADFSKLLSSTIGIKLSAPVLGVLFHVFGDKSGNLDGPGFVEVFKRRNRVPGYKARAWHVHDGGGTGGEEGQIAHACVICARKSFSAPPVPSRMEQ